MLSSVSVAWSDILQHTPIELTDWSCREWRHVQQTQDDSTFGKAAGAGSAEEPWKKRSPFWHLCNVFLKYSKWQRNYTHCKFGACFHRWTEFAFSWRTGKQRPRVVHAVTITCLHCKYSFELQRRQADDPRVVHAMTLAPADFSWRTNREGAHSLGPIWQQLSCTQVRFGVGEKTIEGGDGAYMQWPARTFTVDVCFQWRTVKQCSRVKHAVPQQPVDSNLRALQVFFELQRRQAWEQAGRTSTGSTCNDCNVSGREESGKAMGRRCDDADIHYWSFLSVEELTKGAQGLDRIRSDSNPHPLQILCGIGSRQHATTLSLT